MKEISPHRATATNVEKSFEATPDVGTLSLNSTLCLIILIRAIKRAGICS